MPQDTDIDALLNEDTSPSDQSQGQNQENGSQPQTSEEKIEFDKLTGSTQDRVRSLLKRTKAAEAEAERAKALAYKGVQQLPPPPQQSPDIAQAVKQLDQVGVATKDYVERMIAQREAQREYENKLKSLSDLENGDDGRPKFDRYEYEDFVRQNPKYQYYDPQDVFGIMYSRELIDWETKHRQSGNSGAAPLKNTKTFQGTDVWSPEYIDQQLKEHGMPWYEKNFDKVQKVMEQSQG